MIANLLSKYTHKEIQSIMDTNTWSDSASGEMGSWIDIQKEENFPTGRTRRTDHITQIYDKDQINGIQVTIT